MRWVLCLAFLIYVGSPHSAQAGPVSQAGTQQSAISERHPEPAAPLILGLSLLGLALAQQRQNKSLVNRGNSHIAKADPILAP